jgi:hypothetical protein
LPTLLKPELQIPLSLGFLNWKKDDKIIEAKFKTCFIYKLHYFYNLKKHLGGKDERTIQKPG